ncbi:MULTISPECIES: hypothetical protein [Bacillus]|uniref:hypothetical protein n=1 Tax=Bacillus TaxID=1386 RepID=UPI0003FD6DA1|nr:MULTISPECIES: hypothetical protein [Bacillus]QHZ45213.1 hypothetical protein M654_002290 [Bacillus sp. NSP9.1]WFA04993.1 hypothetical protein P3X63_20870 [Bacillus sp. HSf4]
MKSFVSFLKLWAVMLLNGLMPVRQSQVTVLTSAGATYQQAERFLDGFSDTAVEKKERTSKDQRVIAGAWRKERNLDVYKKAVKRVRAGPELYMCA